MTISPGRVLVTALVAIAGAALTLALLATNAKAQSACSDYTCADYRQHDLDNYTRARGRQVGESTSPDYHKDFVGACADTSADAYAKQYVEFRREQSDRVKIRPHPYEFPLYFDG